MMIRLSKIFIFSNIFIKIVRVFNDKFMGSILYYGVRKKIKFSIYLM